MLGWSRGRSRVRCLTRGKSGQVVCEMEESEAANVDFGVQSRRTAATAFLQQDSKSRTRKCVLTHSKISMIKETYR